MSQTAPTIRRHRRPREHSAARATVRQRSEDQPGRPACRPGKRGWARGRARAGPGDGEPPLPPPAGQSARSLAAAGQLGGMGVLTPAVQERRPTISRAPDACRRDAAPTRPAPGRPPRWLSRPRQAPGPAGPLFWLISGRSTPPPGQDLGLQPPLIPAQLQQLLPFVAGRHSFQALADVSACHPIPRHDSLIPRSLAICEIGAAVARASSTARATELRRARCRHPDSSPRNQCRQRTGVRRSGAGSRASTMSCLHTQETGVILSTTETATRRHCHVSLITAGQEHRVSVIRSAGPARHLDGRDLIVTFSVTG